MVFVFLPSTCITDVWSPYGIEPTSSLYYPRLIYGQCYPLQIPTYLKSSTPPPCLSPLVTRLSLVSGRYGQVKKEPKLYHIPLRFPSSHLLITFFFRHTVESDFELLGNLEEGILRLRASNTTILTTGFHAHRHLISSSHCFQEERYKRVLGRVAPRS